MNISKRALIAEICTADSLYESYKLFDLHSEQLSEYKIIFSSKFGGTPGFSVNKNFSDGSVVRSLFNSDKIVVLDTEISSAMKNGSVTYPIDFSISLDTQALSYLEPYINGYHNKLPKDFEEIFNFISRDDVNVDPMPYIQENLFNLKDSCSAEKIFNKLKAYEVLRTLDKEYLENEKRVKSILSEEELQKKTQEHIARMYHYLDDHVLTKSIQFNFKYMYWHLLAIISIQLEGKKLSTSKKILQLFELCDQEMATLSLREISIAKEYFEKGQKLTFFGKVQSEKSDLFEIIAGMSWDLWHIRQMEKNLTLRPSTEARYYFPSLLTCDKRLVEIIDLYPLKACAYDTENFEPIPFFDGNWITSIAPDDEFQNTICLRFFSDTAIQSREKRRDKAKAHLDTSIEKLEEKICKLANVSKSKV